MIGTRIKNLRTKLNLTQAEFGERIGLKQAVVGMYENGSRGVTDRNISLICEKFNVNEHWLRTGDGKMHIETTDNIIKDLLKRHDLDELDLKIVTEYLKLNSEQRTVIKNYIVNVLATDDYTASAEGLSTAEQTGNVIMPSKFIKVEQEVTEEESRSFPSDYDPYQDDVVQAVIREREYEKSTELSASQTTDLGNSVEKKIS